MRKARLALVVLTLTASVLLCLRPAEGQQIFRNGFESPEPGWQKGASDAPFRELVHDITDTFAHTGQSSEHLQVTADPGTHIYYFYPTGRAPLGDDLTLTLWVKANRPGVQLLARLVLPHERNPNNLDEPLTTLLRGDLYQETSRWHRLELRRPAKLARQQQTLMRAELKRDVDFTDAYLDQVVLNVYAGPGVTEAWIDDLEIGPVRGSTTAQPPSRSGTPVKLLPPSDSPRAPARTSLVELDRDQLLVNGKRFLFRGIRHSDTPLKTLRDAGFNAIWFDHTVSPALLEEAVNLGLWIVPALPAENDPLLSSPEALRQEIGRFLERDAVLFWDVGGGLTEEQTGSVFQTARLVRAADPQRPIGADAWDGFRPYSRGLDLVGAHRWPLMTGLELGQYRQWLSQRRQLARSGAFVWTWVQTHLPDWYCQLVYERPSTAGFDEPIGPQPEQIRLLTYTALAAGCRGLGFWSDRFLADTHQGRDRLLALALLNQELKMLEPLLVTAEEPGWVPTSEPEVQAAVFRTDRGVLVLPIWLGRGAQYVPGQSAKANLTMTIPQIPVGTQAWEVSPAEVRSLRTERVVGGVRITVPEFGLTSAIVFTGDNGPTGLLVRFQEQARQSAQVAAQWAEYLAEEEIAKASRVNEQLEKSGHKLPDGDKLMDDARRRLRACVDLWNRGDYRDAYAEAQRAVRPVRILMRAQWEAAVKGIGLPVTSPYAVGFYTLPRHYQFMELISQGRPGNNALPNGDFEVQADRSLEGWTPQATTLDDVDMIARRVTDAPKQGKQCLLLEIKPKNPAAGPIVALERTYLGINSPVVHLPPGSLVRISGWVWVPKPITASADGALLFDSAGGEPLAVRVANALPWYQFTLYRRVPASGTISVTLALTGIGKAYFDDIRIEPLIRKDERAAR